jgi:hypothetical protein
MYPVSEAYEEKIKELDRVFEAKIQTQHSQGVLDLSDKDIVAGSLVYNESSQAGDDFTIGSTVASDFSVEILNKPEYANYDFEGATINPTIGLLLSSEENAENYFLTAPQPSEFEEGEGTEIWEYVPLGIFNIDEVNRQRNTIKIKAIDNMIKLDKPYSLSSLGYPATLLQIYIDACNVCDVMPAMGSFTNCDYVVQERPDGDLTFRDIVGYIAELSGTFARCNRTGALELTWYQDTDTILTPANRFNFTPRDDHVLITGVMATVDDTTYLAGTDEYVIDLSENPLLQGDYETVLPDIFNNVKDTVFTPFESNWQGNPAIQAGDIITQADRDGKIYNTLVTTSTYKYRGSSILKAQGLPISAKGYKGSTNKKITNIIRKEVKPIGDQLTTLEQAQLNATQLIANMLGGYAIRDSDTFYVADNPDLDIAQKVWKWGIGGFGYSSTGKDGPYTTGITADGSIVAMLVAANIITADMINTGELRSVDGSTRINLDDGTFNFKNVLKYVNEKLSITGLDDVEIGSDVGVKATHSPNGEYTQLNSAGLKRFVPIPIYKEVPTGIRDFEGFESGAFPEDWERLSTDGIEVINTDSKTGTYCMQIANYQGDPFVRASRFITKDCELSFWYKSLTGSTFLLDGKKHTLVSTEGEWVQFTINVTKGFHVFQWESGYTAGKAYALRLDDVTFEENPVNYVVDGYDSQGYDYNFRTYVGEAATYGKYFVKSSIKDFSFSGNSDSIPDIWVQLPDDFRGKNFNVVLSFRNIDVTSTNWSSLCKIELDVLETDYENARFKVRAKAYSYVQYYFLYQSTLQTGEYREWIGLNFIYIASY